MADPSEPEAGGATTTAEPAEPTGDRSETSGRRRTLDRRTIAIGAVLGIAAALPDGGTTDLASFQDGQPMLVNLWQSFCRPCVDEMPLLEQAREDNPDVTFVGVATQDQVAKAEKLAKQTGITYPWALDPDGTFFYEAQGVGMPTTLLLSADGKVIDSKTGEFKSTDQLQAFLDQAG